MLIITDHEDLRMCASFSLHEPWSFLIFCLELLLSSLFPATPKHNTTVMSLHFFFAVSFFKIVKHFFFLLCRSVCERGMWWGPKSEWRDRGRNVPSQVTINTQERQVKKLWYSMILSLCHCVGPRVTQFKLFYIWDRFSTSCDLLLFPNPPVIKQMSWQEC